MTEYKQGKRTLVETISIEINPLLSGKSKSELTLTIEDGKLSVVRFLEIALVGDHIDIAKAALKAVDDEMSRRMNRRE